MQNFYIKKGSVNPSLRIELIDDARYDFLKTYEFNNAIQNADVYFTMYDENNRKVIHNGLCNIIQSGDDSCVDRYIIEYKWNKRDTKKEGEYRGSFEIIFKGDLYEDGKDYPKDNLIVPIHEELNIYVKD